MSRVGEGGGGGGVVVLVVVGWLVGWSVSFGGGGSCFVLFRFALFCFVLFKLS